MLNDVVCEIVLIEKKVKGKFELKTKKMTGKRAFSHALTLFIDGEERKGGLMMKYTTTVG